jgi:hypothetical protein
MITSTEELIAGSTLTPFIGVSYLRCRACNNSVTLLDRIFAYLSMRKASSCSMRYCPGGKPPTENKGMLDAMMTGQVEAFNPCAGIHEPHLHVACRMCGASWLMKTQNRT